MRYLGSKKTFSRLHLRCRLFMRCVLRGLKGEGVWFIFVLASFSTPPSRASSKGKILSDTDLRAHIVR